LADRNESTADAVVGSSTFFEFSTIRMDGFLGLKVPFDGRNDSRPGYDFKALIYKQKIVLI
jgi:hypothetical protein